VNSKAVSDQLEKRHVKQDNFSSNQNWRRLLDLGLLYASKSGGVIVGVFVLPWYQRLLGADAFGVVALILSLQAFLLMMDLGTSTLVGRDVAITKNARDHLPTWRAAVSLLHIVYSGLLILAIAVNIFLDASLPTLQVVLCSVLFWALTVQNVGQSALLARRQYAFAGSVQVVSVLGRAAITIFALTHFSAELETFLLAQAFTAVAQMMVTSWFCRQALAQENPTFDIKTLFSQIVGIARRGAPLVLFGLSGAAVLQLDKVIIPMIVSPAALTPYFLASALCLTPISVLAGPVNQYFFPSIIESINSQDAEQTIKRLKRLIVVICAVVSIPSVILWLGRESIVNMWLNHEPIASEVVRYVEILLPGIALGALGYVPYNILIAHEDYRAHALLSAGMTVLTIAATALAAAFGSILLICWIYASYHALSGVMTWWRASYLVSDTADNYALGSAYFAIALIAGIAGTTAMISYVASTLIN
jgi:O-antigen/teichoic acid export membrane protein